MDWRGIDRVRPRRDWKPNAVYTVTLLPGMADLRGNVMKTGASVIFATGPTIPNTQLAGVLYDWVAGTVARSGAVEAIALPDSIVYVARTDTAGRFTFAHLPPGAYALRAWIDANSNRELDSREAYDSAAVALRDTASLTLWRSCTIRSAAHQHVQRGFYFGVELNSRSPEQAIDTTLSFDAPTRPRPLRACSAEAWDRARADSIARADTMRAPARPTPGRGEFGRYLGPGRSRDS